MKKQRIYLAEVKYLALIQGRNKKEATKCLRELSCKGARIKIIRKEMDMPNRVGRGVKNENGR